MYLTNAYKIEDDVKFMASGISDGFTNGKMEDYCNAHKMALRENL